MKTVLVLSLAALIAAPAAMADEANIAGQWTFTAKIESDCEFGGMARLKHRGDQTYSGELTARQSCPMLEEDFIVRQTCEASRIGQQLSVRCTIAEFLSGPQTPYYLPDNFTLTIASDERMHGALVSSGNPKPAEWVRAKSGIS